MSGVDDKGFVAEVHSCELGLQGFYDHACSEVGAADANDHHHLAFALQALHIGFQTGEHGGVYLLWQVDPAEEVVAGGVTFDEVLLGGENFGQKGVDVLIFHMAMSMFYVYFNCLHFCYFC